MNYQSTKILDLGSCAFRQWKADHSHCKFIHGYKLQAKFWFGCSTLDNKNWVVDFGGLKDLKCILEKQFDHTFCVAADDPQLDLFKQLHSVGACDLRIMPKGVGIERTAEWCFEMADMHIRATTNNRCWVDKVEVWEHDKNSALVSYQGQPELLSAPSAPIVTNHTTVGNSESTTVQPLEQLPVEQPQPVKENGPRPAVVGNKITPGLSNPFGGTSWGL